MPAAFSMNGSSEKDLGVVPVAYGVAIDCRQ
jgi:hypothetical protein